VSTLPAIALLGRKDQPTDAVEEYCRHLSQSLQAHDIQLEIRRVPWELHGWPASLDALRLMAMQWRGRWVLVQYTALAWSARGFPHRILRVFNILKNAGARIGVVFHDVEPFAAVTLSAKFRRWIQLRAMRQILSRADLAVFTVPIAKIDWLSPAPPANAIFIPVGPNLPVTASSSVSHQPPTVAVFSITGGDAGIRETQTIVSAVRFASQKLGSLRLSVFGRHSEWREAELREGLRDVPVAISVEDVLPDDQVAQRFCDSDVLLFVRGGISSRRSSAVAGIACGLPVIASANSETAPPITDAGVVLVSLDDQEELNAALVRVLSDSPYRHALAARSRAIYKHYFSWPVIAQSYAARLKAGPGPL